MFLSDSFFVQKYSIMSDKKYNFCYDYILLWLRRYSIMDCFTSIWFWIKIILYNTERKRVSYFILEIL